MKQISRRCIRCMLIGGLLAIQLARPAQAADADGTLVFGFLPILSTQKLISRFKPLVDQLSEELGQPIRMETAPDFAEFLHRTRAQRYDILFTAPHFYYLANHESGYQVVVRADAAELKALIVATRASGITSIEGLRGKTIATTDPLSLATALVRDYLRKAGLDPDKDVTMISTPSHNTALLTAYNGVADAAGLMTPPFSRAAANIRKQMLVLATTSGTPHMPIAVSPTLKPDQIKKITDCLLALNKTESGKTMFKRLAWPLGFTRARNDEYKSLEGIVSGMQLN